MEKFTSALGGGIVQRFNSRSASFKFGVKLGVLIFSLGILALYAWFVYLYEHKSKLGLIVSVSIILMDVFNYILYSSKMVETPAGIVFLLVVNRSLMVGMGEEYWIYGYMILYILYGSAFVVLIVSRRFPLEIDVARRTNRFGNLVKEQQSAKRAAEIMSKGATPEQLLALLSLFYIALVAAVAYIDFEGKNLKPIIVLQGVNQEKEVSYLVAAGVSVASVLSLFFILSLMRIYIRKASRTENYGTNEAISAFKNNRWCGLMTIYIFFNFTMFALWSAFAYWITREKQVVLWGVLPPLFVMFYMRAYVYLVLNDYSYLQNIEKINKKIDKHNLKVEQIEVNRDKIIR